MNYHMLGASLILMLLLSGCRNMEHKAAARTTVAAVTEMAVTSIQKESEADQEMTMEILIGDKTCAVILEDNDTAKELMARLPMELTMDDLHGNEKYHDLPESLPTAAENIGTIQAGDLMLFGSDCLVLFYKEFETTYTYTRIGRLENPLGLSEMLGSGSVTVTLKK